MQHLAVYLFLLRFVVSFFIFSTGVRGENMGSLRAGGAVRLIRRLFLSFHCLYARVVEGRVGGVV